MAPSSSPGQTYDPRNQPIGLSLNRNGVANVTYSYDPLGRVFNRLLGSTINSTAVYDPAGRLSVLEHLNPAGSDYALYTGTYDPVGNRLTQARLLAYAGRHRSSSGE